MIVFKNNQDIYYAFFNNDFDLDSLKRWLEYYRKFDESIKAYRMEGDSFIELEIEYEEHQQEEVVERKTSKK